MDQLWIWGFLALITEVVIVEGLYKWLPILTRLQEQTKDFVNIKATIALTLGLVFAFGANLDFFIMFSIPYFYPYVGPVISALFIMAGHGVIDLAIQSWKNNVRQEVQEELYFKLEKKGD